MENNKAVVVTGGRDYHLRDVVHSVLNSLDISTLYVGDAKGADYHAREWASLINLPIKIFKADWDQHGHVAGPIRNSEMLDAAGPGAIVIAFPGGRGTRNCVNQAHDRGMIVLKVES